LINTQEQQPLPEAWKERKRNKERSNKTYGKKEAPYVIRVLKSRGIRCGM
jgi:hypothetical protein